MHGDVPAPIGPLERGNRGLAFEKALGQQIDHAPRGLLVADGKGRAVGAGGEGGGHVAGAVAWSQVFGFEISALSTRYTPSIRALPLSVFLGREIRLPPLCIYTLDRP